MKLQMLYIFVFAAPLLARLLSPEPSTPPVADETVAITPAKAESIKAPAKEKPTPHADRAEHSKETPKRTSLHRLSTAPTHASL